MRGRYGKRIKEDIWQEELDNQIREALQNEAHTFSLAENRGGAAWTEAREKALRQQVMERIKQDKKEEIPYGHTCMPKEQGKKEEMFMRYSKWSVKKIAVIAAAMCILGSAAVMAAGKFSGTTGHSSAQEEFTSYGEIAKAKKKYGISFEIKGPETFENGFTFKSGRPVHVSGVDEQGNETALPVEMHLVYGKAGMADVNLNQGKTRPGNGDSANENGDIRYRYIQDHYKFVPASYELTEADKAAEAAGELYISYGSDQVEENIVSSVTWSAAGVTYTLMSFDTTLTQNEMIEMAKEIMK